MIKFWRRKPKIEKDLIPIISQKAIESKKSIDIIVDEILRRHFIEGPLYRCTSCHSAHTELIDEFDGKYRGFCWDCNIFRYLYKT